MRSLRFVLLLAPFVSVLVAPAAAKEDWQSELHKWAVSNDTNPACKVRYITGVYRPDMGDQPAWGMMSEKMFKWFSKDGVKLAPSLCLASRNTKDKAGYRILFSASEMKTVSRTTHGSEVQTINQPFSADVNSRTSYSDGSTANTTATINGQQTSTVVVPTETTISRSSVALYMYTYHANGDQLELIASDSVVFSRVAASGSGDNAAGAELGAGIGNLIRAYGDRHRTDKLEEEALKAILADSQDGSNATNEVPAMRSTPTDGVQSAPLSPAQSSMNSESIRSVRIIDALKEQAAGGGAEAQFRLGLLYVQGAGVPEDDAQALFWYRKAAEQGLAAAQNNLGSLYDHGQGVAQSHEQAAFWYRKAAVQNHAEAQHNLGMLYKHGWGVPQDYDEAYFWLNLAAAKGIEGVGPEIADRVRDEAGSHLTRADLAHQQERARKWFEDHAAPTPAQ